MSQLKSAVSASARSTIQTAFEDLERTVTPVDAREIQSKSTLQQVREAALALENQLAARQSLRNMRRLTPLISGLEHYAKAVDVLCNGTPYLAWIWSPITLILRVASEYTYAFEQLMKGYSRIADNLKRFEALGDAFNNNAGFQQTLAVFYADILQFHKHAYKFVRRNSWQLLFLTSWGRFERRFDCILENLERHANLIDLEANAINIAEARRAREDLAEEIRRDEEERLAKQYNRVLSWLKAEDSEQISIFDSISADAVKFSGTSGWILKNTKIKAWLQPKPHTRFVWLQGNPGSGKSVLSSQLVTFIQVQKAQVLRHFCNHTYPSSTRYDCIIRSLLLQLLRGNGDLVAYVHQECVLGKKSPTLPYLERLLHTLCISLSDEPREMRYVWIVLDGLDECEAEKQSSLLHLLSQLVARDPTYGGTVYKVLVASRSSSALLKRLRKKPVVSLTDEAHHMQGAIKSYAAQRLGLEEDLLHQLDLEAADIEELVAAIARKAEGMFLYARLVLDYLTSNVFMSGEEMKDSVQRLPPTLAEFYQTILTRILARLDSRSVERIRSIFGWIAFAKRPLKKLEFLSALTHGIAGAKVTKLAPQFILDKCSPLIEERRDSTLAFIHVSVKEFLQGPVSNLAIKEHEAVHEHGVATLAYLISGLEVFRDSFSETSRSLQLVKGVHGFHVYATEYWTEYLLHHMEHYNGSKTSSKLFCLATTLANMLEDTSAPSPMQETPTLSEDNKLLELLREHDLLYKHVEAALKARSRKRLEVELTQEEGPNSPTSLPKELTLDGISILLNSYQSTVENLLRQDSCPGASAEEFELFRTHFRSSAFTCRLRACPRATVGFESKELRREHEVAHAGGIRCKVLGCQYPLFRTPQALKTHMNTVHNPPPVPKTIRRVKAIDFNTKVPDITPFRSMKHNRNGKAVRHNQGNSDPQGTRETFMSKDQSQTNGVPQASSRKVDDTKDHDHGRTASHNHNAVSPRDVLAEFVEDDENDKTPARRRARYVAKGSKKSQAQPPEEGAEYGSKKVKCACGWFGNDGSILQCRQCNTWQHKICYYDPWEFVEGDHKCKECHPRAIGLDKEREEWLDLFGFGEPPTPASFVSPAPTPPESSTPFGTPPSPGPWLTDPLSNNSLPDIWEDIQATSQGEKQLSPLETIPDDLKPTGSTIDSDHDLDDILERAKKYLSKFSAPKDGADVDLAGTTLRIDPDSVDFMLSQWHSRTPTFVDDTYSRSGDTSINEKHEPFIENLAFPDPHDETPSFLENHCRVCLQSFSSSEIYKQHVCVFKLGPESSTTADLPLNEIDSEISRLLTIGLPSAGEIYYSIPEEDGFTLKQLVQLFKFRLKDNDVQLFTQRVHFVAIFDEDTNKLTRRAGQDIVLQA